MLIPGKNLPSVREQVELCRNIASQLVSTENSRSKGATMFFKRVKKAHTWEVPQRDTEEQKAIEEEDDELMRKKLAETLLNGNEKSATKNLSLVMNPRGRIHSLSSLKAEGVIVVEHNAIQPDLMSRLIKDLESPEANPRAAELFAKRKAALQKLEEEQLKQQQQMSPLKFTQPQAQQQQQQQQQQLQQSLVPSQSVPNIPSSLPLKQPIQFTPKAPLKPIQPTANLNGSNNLFNRNEGQFKQQFNLDSQSASTKRYSLLDPDIFVPSVTSALSSSAWLKSSSIKTPAPWKAVDGNNPGPGKVSSVSPVPFATAINSTPKVGPVASGVKIASLPNPGIELNQENATATCVGNLKHFTDSTTIKSAPSVAAVANKFKPPTTTTAAATATNSSAELTNCSGNNPADNYYNYFYQTLKYSNPYQNLPESILL